MSELFKDSELLRDVPKMKRHFEQTLQRNFSDENSVSILVRPLDDRNVKSGTPSIRLRLEGYVLALTNSTKKLNSF